MSNEKPILFSTPMVRAILEGNKTQTRRIVKPQPQFHHDFKCATDIVGGLEDHAGDNFRCPFGQPGDRLWVRETWQAFPVLEDEGGYPYKPIPRKRPASAACVIYAADRENDGPFRPSIHMPRWASRITLEITGVRVERLEDISEEDAIAEGISLAEAIEMPCSDGAVAAFSALWESINGPGSWDANPWVWVIEFRVA